MTRPRESLLIGWMPNATDLGRMLDKGWYRIPLDVQVGAEVAESPPLWFAPLESASISKAGQRIVRYAPVVAHAVKPREELLGSEAPGPKAGRLYCQLLLGEVRELRQPLVPRSPRANTFIRTTIGKLLSANEFNDIFNDSPYENQFWERLKDLKIQAERQFPVQFNIGGVRRQYTLDFALSCANRNLNIEIDGLHHHTIQSNSESDSDRDAHLTSRGWAVHRVRVTELRRDPVAAMNLVAETIERYGGVSPDARFVATSRGPVRQLGLFGSARGSSA